MPAPLSSTSSAIGQISRPLVIAASALMLLVIGWAVIGQMRLSEVQDDVVQLRDELTQLRANANATAYIFEPTEIAPPNMRGIVYIGTSGSGVVAVSNLPPTGEDHTFQLWLLNADGAATPAGALLTSPTSEGFALIPADSRGYTSIAISLQPNDGETNAGGYLLVVDVNRARGSVSIPLQ